jgi:nucleoside-triphosphatase
MHRKNILITALPGTGKTTLVLTIAAALASFNPCGFVTREMRRNGVRHGFEILGLDGRTQVLADVSLTSDHRAGKYGIDVRGLEEYLETLHIGADTRIVVVDEIGRMEWMSPRFRTFIGNILDSPTPVIATIAMRADRAIEAIKARDDVHLFVLTRKNRDQLGGEILGVVTAVLAGTTG